MQAIRSLVRILLPLLGMLVAFAGVVNLQDDVSRLLAVLLGILIVEAAVWNLANPFLPSGRRYHELRAEVEVFLARLPALNSAAVDARCSDSPADWERHRSILAEMHASVERMGTVAGKGEGIAVAGPTSA